MNKIVHIGMDVGSTTVKIVVMDEDLKEIYTSYERHYSDTKNTVCKVLEELVEKYKDKEFTIALTGSGAMSTAKFLDVPFIQEVVACKRSVERYIPQTNVVIELGGEDAKIIYFGRSVEQRMNGTCAGGTGAFLDQMASLLNTDTAGLNELAKGYQTIYPIASRCGVFAKTDVQPLLNEGAAKEDIAVSILQAVVNQTISGLACGRPIRGNVAFLGGPLTYLPELRKRFVETLHLTPEQTIVPEEAHLLVAKGACLEAKDESPISVEKLKSKIQVLKHSHDTTTVPLKPLFSTNVEYDEFKARHEKDKVAKKPLSEHKGDCFVGIDAGSTTSKLVVIDRDGTLLYSAYQGNGGKPLDSIIEMLKKLYSVMPKEAIIRYSGVTGYGEKLIQTALNVDLNEIETIAHYTAAKKFEPKVTSIVDIGGQDMKYIKLKNNTIDNIMLNEACSSGCGSFIETFAKSLNLNIEEFVKEALEAQNPVDLGSRCTVFMNSKIKQAQKEGYSVGDISAGLSYSVIKNAIEKAQQEYQKCRQDIHEKGKETIEYIEKNNLKGIVLAGRPYHVDPEINHGIDTLITSLGMCVLTEDSVADKALPERPLRVVDQWMFHSRLYAAADFVGRHDNLELVQINSFGCGVDAVTTDEVEEILTSFGKMYTLIKIDEVNNLGAVRIRLRSLLASINKRLNNKKDEKETGEYFLKKNPFTEEMKKEYVILIPQMAPIHFDFIEPVLQSEGYKAKLLRECTQNTIETGLKYVNNDACYPSIITTGQMIEALESGEYDVNKTALIMSQTGGGCRATNYIGFIRKALKDAGFGQVPVISFNVVGMEKNPGFKLTLPLVEKLLKSMVYADLLQKMLYKNRAYEKNKGETDKLFAEWMEKAKKLAINSSSKEFSKSIYQMVDDFEKIEWKQGKEKPKVGIVGEILIKYHPFGNNYVANLLEKEGAEVVLPDFMGFVKYVAANGVISHQLLKNNGLKSMLFDVAIKLINSFEKDAKKALEKSKKGYLPTCDIWHLADNVKSVLSTGNQTGEGWFLTAEMLEYMENGIQNIVCVQPFACLPNHVVGKGVIKTIRDMFPDANIVPVDYDPGASEANQTNRIKLLMTVAKDNLKIKQKEKKMAEKENKNTTKV